MDILGKIYKVVVIEDSPYDPKNELIRLLLLSIRQNKCDHKMHLIRIQTMQPEIKQNLLF